MGRLPRRLSTEEPATLDDLLADSWVTLLDESQMKARFGTDPTHNVPYTAGLIEDYAWSGFSDNRQSLPDPWERPLASVCLGLMGTVTIDSGDETWTYSLLPGEQMIDVAEARAQEFYDQLNLSSTEKGLRILDQIGSLTETGTPVDLTKYWDEYDPDNPADRGQALIEHVLENTEPFPHHTPQPAGLDDTPWMWGSTEELRDWWTPTITITNTSETGDTVEINVGYRAHTQHRSSINQSGWVNLGDATINDRQQIVELTIHENPHTTKLRHAQTEHTDAAHQKQSSLSIAD